ncbi:nucleotide-binding universal stress UspA family protein [Streptomyces sp. 846.5]|nr:universal stress protein [Streptomyces sp. 846.5]TDT97351.1 nucleotide-binding universal stress UspA family protein [Streptomyces sp. 846.5]
MNEPSARRNPEQHGQPARVVVGIDASVPAREALDWAAAEAARRAVPLRIAHSWSLAPYQVPAKEQGDIAIGAREGAGELVRQSRERVLAQYGDLQVDVEVLPEEPVQGLIRTAGADSMLVVGTRGHNRFAATMLGSVSQRLVAHAPVPVVVVRAAEVPHGADVVLGAAPDETDAPIDFAFGEAQRRGVPLRVIRTWMYPQSYPGIVVVPPLDRIRRDRAESMELTEVLARAHKEFPDVEVVQQVTMDEPEGALVEASAGTALVVIGAQRRKHPFALPLGHVAQRVLHHAHCPVAVVPHS